jgi:predicted small metal-binding protein
MRKCLECGDIVPGCNYVARANTDEDLMLKAAEHARNVHGVQHMSEQLRAKIKACIKEEAAT